MSNTNTAWIHPFERATGHPAPFRCIGMNERKHDRAGGGAWMFSNVSRYQPAGTCDVCGTGIMYAYRIEASNGAQFEVGCDCLRKTDDTQLIAEMRAADRAAEREAWYNSPEAREAREREASRLAAVEAERAANREMHAAWLAEISAMLESPAATDFEKRVLRSCRYDAETYGFGRSSYDVFRDPSSCESRFERDRIEAQNRRNGAVLATIARLALCRTSTHATAARGALRCYRDALSFDGQYGVTYVNFLTDGERAYVYRGGSFCVRVGDVVTATWSVGDADTRDGLVSTRLLRPRKIAIQYRFRSEVGMPHAA